MIRASKRSATGSWNFCSSGDASAPSWPPSPPPDWPQIATEAFRSFSSPCLGVSVALVHLDEAVLHRIAGEAGHGVDAELALDVPAVGVDGAYADG